MRKVIVWVVLLLVAGLAFPQVTREAEKVMVSDTANAPSDSDPCDPRRDILWKDQEAGEDYYCDHTTSVWNLVPAGTAAAAPAIA